MKKPIILRHRFPTIEEIAKDVGMPMSQVREIQSEIAEHMDFLFCSACGPKRKCKRHDGRVPLITQK